MTKFYTMASPHYTRITLSVIYRRAEDLDVDKRIATHVFNFISNTVVNPRVGAMNKRHGDGTVNVTNTLHHWSLCPAKPRVQRLERYFTTDQLQTQQMHN